MSEPSIAVNVEGIALWSSRLPEWEIAKSVIRGQSVAPPATAGRPAPSLLAPTERRRAPDTVAVALEVAARACQAADRDPATLASVFASTYGDLAINDYMCSTLVNTPTLVSPIKFHNSVHNAAAGYWSIGTRSHASYTAISAFQYTFAAGLLEAVTQVITEQQPVLYVAFDIEAKGPLAQVAPSSGIMGTALVLAPMASARQQARLTLQLEQSGPTAATPACSPAASLVAGNALAPCLPLFEALAVDQPCSVILALSDWTTLRVDVGDQKVDG